MFFDPLYLLFIGPAMLLGFWAQWRVKSAFTESSQVPASMTGAQVARKILDASGLHQVSVEQVAGQLTDHYDPRGKVLRLSSNVYGVRSAAAIGIAAHEAGHALQDAKNYLPLVVRNAAVPVANFGSGISWGLIMIGLMLSKYLVLLGVLAFAGVVLFQLVNLPVEFDASARAKRLLVNMGIAGAAEQPYVSRVLNAAAWTYVAATLQSVSTLAYFIFRYAGMSDE